MLSILLPSRGSRSGSRCGALLLEGASRDMEKLDTNTSQAQGLCQFSEKYKQVYLSLAYSIIFILGLPLNGTVLWHSWCQTKCWSCATIYLVKLMVANLLYVLTLPFLIITYSLDDRWPFGELLCKLVHFLFYTNLYGNILLLTCISVHHFLGVCHPLRSLPCRTRRHAWLGTSTTWALLVFQLLPTLAFSHTDYINGQMIWYDMTNQENFDRFFAYGIVLTSSGFLTLLGHFGVLFTDGQEPDQARGEPHEDRQHSLSQVHPDHPTGVWPLHLLFCALPYHSLLLPHHPLSAFSGLPALDGSQCGLQDMEASGECEQLHQPSPVLSFGGGGKNRVRLLQKLRQNKLGEYPAGGRKRCPGVNRSG
ncbi:LOW QUALITY PROTEIN: P2Y purinoceptor 3-like [Hylobates moloch]|uniref:LOW QUALITY PROTEIN: P2Y purinoceptor 3-like n=1 Tax=Hylobates moloch TaxID=81572 RepID=UPI001362182F|nr:LOW QUALITY PROTEIN: P2Y purinoceptor 3-like [Hylobates moloch]